MQRTLQNIAQELKCFNMLRKDKYKNIQYYVYQNIEKTNLPVIIHIHGAGSRGKDLDLAINSNPIIKFSENSKDEFPFKIYAPQCHADTWFDIYEQLLDFIEFIKEKESKSSIYLTGISMGGYCSWQLLMSKPNLFKKAIICCGGGMYWNADKIKTPIKIFHGKLDKTVFCEESIKMFNAVNASGGCAELTIFDELEHNCWDKVFYMKENYEWLLK